MFARDFQYDVTQDELISSFIKFKVKFILIKPTKSFFKQSI